MYKKDEIQGIPVRGQESTHLTLVNNGKGSKYVGRRLKILFFHNTLPEYRIGWFEELSRLADVQFVFTNESLNKKNYGFDIDYECAADLKYKFLAEGKKGERELDEILEKVANYDFVELPPIDSLREVVCGKKIVRACKNKNVRMGYFWEKWEAPKDEQPVTRKIKNLILRVIPRSIYKNADVIFAVGKKSREYFISNGISEGKIRVIPDVSETPPCEYENIRGKYGITADKKIVMFMGRMMPQKGVRCLIKAFGSMKPEVRETCHLLIAGEGEDKAICEKLAVELCLANVTFAGAVEPKLRGNYFAQCDIFVYPVTYYLGWVDVWGLTLNEAIQHGKIVIATDAVGSAYELIEDGVNGFRVQAGKTDELEKAIEMALENSVKESAIEKDSELMNTFNFHEMAERYISAIKEVNPV